MEIGGRSLESVRRFDLFKRIVALALFAFVIVAYVQNLRSVQADPPEEAAAAVQPDTVAQTAVITPVERNFAEGDPINLTGTGAPNTIVAVFLNGTEEGRIAVDASGAWKMQINRLLPAGTYEANAVAIDENGNYRQQIRSVTQIEVVPTPSEPTPTPPLPTIEPPTLMTPLPESVQVGESLMVSGSGTPGTIVSVLNGVVELGRAFVGSDGLWSLVLELDQAGHYEMRLAASDADGVQRALGDPTPLTVFAPAPSQPILSLDPLPDDFAGGEVTLRGSADPETVIGIVYDGRVYDVVATDANGDFTYTTTLDTPGDHTLAAQVISPNSDAVVISDAVSFTIVGDGAAGASPDAADFVTPTVTLPALDSDFYGGVVPLAGAATPGSTVVVLVNNRTIGVVSADVDATWSYSTTLSVPETYNIYVRVVDANGRTVASSNIETLVVSTPPGASSSVNSDQCAAFVPGEFLPDNQYRVAKCETLTSIARRAGVTIDELVAENPDIKDTSYIVPGQIINLP